MSRKYWRDLELESMTPPFEDDPPANKPSLESIQRWLDERMVSYTDSRQPTEEEVTIAWLLCEVERLKKLLTTPNADPKMGPEA